MIMASIADMPPFATDVPPFCLAPPFSPRTLLPEVFVARLVVAGMTVLVLTVGVPNIPVVLQYGRLKGGTYGIGYTVTTAPGAVV